MMGESRDELTTKVDKANERLHLCLGQWCQPVDDSSDLDWIHLNLVVQYDDAQVLYLGLFKLALLQS
jgi:hypothetical protein